MQSIITFALDRREDIFDAGSEHEKLYDYLKDDVKAVLVEKSYIDKDYRDTYSNFYSKKFANRPSTAYRLHMLCISTI